MIFEPASLSGVVVVKTQPKVDHRGYLARTYCEDTFLAHGLNTFWKQSNQTFTRALGAVRGMHWQADPHPEIKLVRCLAGRVWDVVVDVRRDSPTFGQWEAVELNADAQNALYIPAGFAHGYQCLTADVQLLYMMSASYVPDLSRGIRWNDPAVGITWPLPVTDLSQRDQELPRLADSNM